MRQPPRKVTDRIIDREMLIAVMFVGLTMAIATLLTIDLLLPVGSSAGRPTWRTPARPGSTSWC